MSNEKKWSKEDKEIFNKISQKQWFQSWKQKWPKNLSQADIIEKIMDNLIYLIIVDREQEIISNRDFVNSPESLLKGYQSIIKFNSQNNLELGWKYAKNKQGTILKLKSKILSYSNISWDKLAYEYMQSSYSVEKIKYFYLYTNRSINFIQCEKFTDLDEKIPSLIVECLIKRNHKKIAVVDLQQFWQILKANLLNTTNSKSLNDYINEFWQRDLTIIKGWGQEPLNAWFQNEFLLYFITMSFIKNKRVLIMSNNSLEEIFSRYKNSAKSELTNLQMLIDIFKMK
ncbi:unknown; predicted coding region [Mycoplasmopsis pulmonis]|uniref:Uncharacterized protein n=1 Tax=Mycoplasmopsis pulmonis (strain UAB CTIP) TaxID=272635 RepID=Q98PJ9_MYCPU|nr:hypothetical protein [Mycoplasmopsis pulmonis]MDZ7293425.1 hypothetical protein [Mycoplasmopsis pulmonis]CAC13896.1 unknown; predicted coding region [Mycoplasmopsis pulmonis]VEU68488.1 Uncharacterised protein [Mycoplasmopsis pulmonis]